MLSLMLPSVTLVDTLSLVCLVIVSPIDSTVLYNMKGAADRHYRLREQGKHIVRILKA